MTELNVCIGSSCHLKGSYNVIQTFQQLVERYGLHDELDMKATFCMKRCQQHGVSVCFAGQAYGVAPENASRFFRETVLPALREAPKA